MKINDFLISESASVIDAMKQLDTVARKVLFVTIDMKLVATITDGDIRRWILKKGSLSDSITNVANYEPKYLRIEKKAKARKYMQKHSIEALPIVDENNEIITIVFWNEEEVNAFNKMNVPVVIMSGGLGTRLYPYTKILPKPLIPIGDLPIIEHIINRFHKQGNSKFFIIVNHKKNMIKAYLNEIQKDYEIVYIDENEPLGTGGGLSLLKGQIKEPFILSNCDILIENDYSKMYRFHLDQNNFITIICSLKVIKIPYGVVDVREDGHIEKMNEKPEVSFLVNTGMYIVDSRVINDLKLQEKIHFTEIIERYRNSGEKIGIYPISESSWMDMGQLDELDEMKRRLESE